MPPTLFHVTLERINPAQLPASPAFTQVVVARGTRTIYVAGQVAPDAREGDDFADQARAVHECVRVALDAAGATPADVAKITTYVVDHRPELIPVISECRTALFGEHRPASTLVGVAALARPEFKIEVEAIAVVED